MLEKRKKKETLGSQLGTSIFKGKEKYYFNILKSCFEIDEKKERYGLRHNGKKQLKPF